MSDNDVLVIILICTTFIYTLWSVLDHREKMKDLDVKLQQEKNRMKNERCIDSDRAT